MCFQATTNGRVTSSRNRGRFLANNTQNNDDIVDTSSQATRTNSNADSELTGNCFGKEPGVGVQSPNEGNSNENSAHAMQTSSSIDSDLVS